MQTNRTVITMSVGKQGLYDDTRDHSLVPKHLF